jgi:hypothetical protein
MNRAVYTCKYCKTEIECSQSTLHNVRGGHVGRCKERLNNNFTPNKRRALNPEEFATVTSVAFYDDSYEFDVEDWGAVEITIEGGHNHAFEEKYLSIFGNVYEGMESSGDVYLFQQNLLSIYEQHDFSTPLRTAWVRGADGTVSGTSWEDYVKINAYHVKHGLSISAGDDLLQLMVEIAARQKCVINLPKQMKSIRYITFCVCGVRWKKKIVLLTTTHTQTHPLWT